MALTIASSDGDKCQQEVEAKNATAFALVRDEEGSVICRVLVEGSNVKIVFRNNPGWEPPCLSSTEYNEPSIVVWRR